MTTRHLPTPSVVLGSSVHLGTAWAARRLARRHRARFVFEVRDLWPETLIATGALSRNSPVARAMLALEASLARSASLIVSPLSGVGRYMQEVHGVPISRFVWVSNGVKLEGRIYPDPPACQQLRIQYLGSIGRVNGVDVILDAIHAANLMLKTPCAAQIIGFGPRRAQLMQRVTKAASLSQQVAFVDAVPSENVPSVMQWGNAVVLAIPDFSGLYEYGISMNKLFEYLASGRWLIMGSSVPHNPASGAPGVTVCAPTVEGLAQAFIEAARMPVAERIDRARKNRQFVAERYDYSVLAQRLDAAFGSLE